MSGYTTGMIKAFVRNTVFFAALVVGATISGLTAHWTISGRGVFGPLLLDAQSLPLALLAAILSLAVCTGLGIVVGRVMNSAMGMFALGGGMFGLAWRMGTVVEMAHDGSPGLLVVESVLWAILVLAATILVFRFAGRLPDVEPDENGREPHWLLSVEAAKSFASGLLVLPIVWFVAQTGTKGQMIGAVFCGAMVVGLAGRLISPHVQPILLFASPVLFGAIGHAIGLAMLKTPLDVALVADTIPAFNRPMPVDYAAASMMGVAAGLGWAKSFLHVEESEPHTVQAS